MKIRFFRKITIILPGNYELEETWFRNKKGPEIQEIM